MPQDEQEWQFGRDLSQLSNPTGLPHTLDAIATHHNRRGYHVSEMTSASALEQEIVDCDHYSGILYARKTIFNVLTKLEAPELLQHADCAQVLRALQLTLSRHDSVLSENTREEYCVKYPFSLPTADQEAISALHGVMSSMCTSGALAQPLFNGLLDYCINQFLLSSLGMYRDESWDDGALESACDTFARSTARARWVTR